jgi:hypothetical protein
MIGLFIYNRDSKIVPSSTNERWQISPIQVGCPGIILTNPGITVTFQDHLIITKPSGEGFPFLADTFTVMGLLTLPAADCLLSFIEQLSPARVCLLL